MTMTWGDAPMWWGLTPMSWGPIDEPTSQPVYQVVIVDTDDAVIDVLAPVVVDHWEHVLKGVAEAELVIPLDASGLHHLKTAAGRPAIGYPRVRIHRDGEVVFRGYPDDWRFDLAGGVVVLGLKCMVGHMDHLVFGGAERVNFVQNPGAEDGAIHWEGVNGCNVETTTTTTARGGTSLKLTGNGGTSYAKQLVTVPFSDEFRHGYYVSCWIRVPAGNHWPAGLSIVRFYDGVQFPERSFWADPPDDYPFDTWVKLDAGPIGVNANVHGTLEVRLSAYDGEEVFYDEVRVSRRDATTATPGSDVATMVQTIFATAATKGDLGWSRSVTPTGVILDGGYVYPHDEHGGMLSALDDWDTLVDWTYRPRNHQVKIGPPSSVGVERSDLAVGDIQGTVDDLGVGSQGVATSAIILLDQDVDVTREEGGYVDSTKGFLWEVVDRAAPHASMKEADRQARTTVEQASSPLQQVGLVMPMPPGGRCPADWLAEGFDVGDRLPYRQTAGPFELAGLQQVVKVTVHPVDGDDMTIDLVEFPEDSVS